MEHKAKRVKVSADISLPADICLSSEFEENLRRLASPRLDGSRTNPHLLTKCVKDNRSKLFIVTLIRLNYRSRAIAATSMIVLYRTLADRGSIFVQVCRLSAIKVSSVSIDESRGIHGGSVSSGHVSSPAVQHLPSTPDPAFRGVRCVVCLFVVVWLHPLLLLSVVVCAARQIKKGRIPHPCTNTHTHPHTIQLLPSMSIYR